MTNDREEGRKKRKKRIITLSIALSAVERAVWVLLHTSTMQKGRRSLQESSTDNPLNSNQKESYLHILAKYQCALFINFPIFETISFIIFFPTPLPMERVWRRQSTYLDILPEKEREEEGTVPPPSSVSPLDREKKRETRMGFAKEG